VNYAPVVRQNRTNECSLRNWKEIGSYNTRDKSNLRRDVEAKLVSGSDHRNAVKCKGKIHPRTRHEGPEGNRGLALLFL